MIVPVLQWLLGPVCQVLIRHLRETDSMANGMQMSALVKHCPVTSCVSLSYHHKHAAH